MTFSIGIRSTTITVSPAGPPAAADGLAHAVATPRRLTRLRAVGLKSILAQSCEVVICTAGQTIGLRVDEFLGSQDIVIKSLSDNFIHIRGLSGASILGDGSVCLMLDVGTVIDMAIKIHSINRCGETWQVDRRATIC